MDLSSGPLHRLALDGGDAVHVLGRLFDHDVDYVVGMDGPQQASFFVHYGDEVEVVLPGKGRALLLVGIGRDGDDVPRP